MPDDQTSLAAAEPVEVTPPAKPITGIEITCPEESRAYTGPVVFGLFKRGDVLAVPEDQSAEAAAVLIADGTATPY